VVDFFIWNSSGTVPKYSVYRDWGCISKISLLLWIQFLNRSSLLLPKLALYLSLSLYWERDRSTMNNGVDSVLPSSFQREVRSLATCWVTTLCLPWQLLQRRCCDLCLTYDIASAHVYRVGLSKIPASRHIVAILYNSCSMMRHSREKYLFVWWWNETYAKCSHSS